MISLDRHRGKSEAEGAAGGWAPVALSFVSPPGLVVKVTFPNRRYNDC
jgi:hypothetical protein